MLASSPPTGSCVFLPLSPIHYPPLLFFLSLSLSFSCFVFKDVNAWECKRPSLLSFNGVAGVCVCLHVLRCISGGTRNRARHCSPHEALSGVRPLCLSVYQHNAARWDKWRQVLQYRVGSFGAWIINIFMRAFHSLCGALCCYGRWHPAVGRALITHG